MKETFKVFGPCRKQGLFRMFTTVLWAVGMWRANRGSRQSALYWGAVQNALGRARADISGLVCGRTLLFREKKTKPKHSLNPHLLSSSIFSYSPLHTTKGDHAHGLMMEPLLPYIPVLTQNKS